ncbi:oxaloacetate decarboxylase [Carnobacterium jeotgali]|uniref:oxaloacetate decarboxylase n=1 Tax=Carnobacterium jeotgali TaxID=545534 RepID=UPI001EE22205|nr:oxaloacetate decarboxylase [Carnobacterium jeotgali]
MLIGWQLIHQMMKFRPKKYQEIESFSPEKQNDLAVDEDEETRMVAVLMALILANDEQQDKTYCVTKIERIR